MTHAPGEHFAEWRAFMKRNFMKCGCIYRKILSG